MLHPGFTEFEATARYSDGSTTTRRFAWWADATDYELKLRATQIWSVARAIGLESDALTVVLAEPVCVAGVAA